MWGGPAEGSHCQNLRREKMGFRPRAARRLWQLSSLWPLPGRWGSGGLEPGREGKFCPWQRWGTDWPQTRGDKERNRHACFFQGAGGETAF